MCLSVSVFVSFYVYLREWIYLCSLCVWAPAYFVCLSVSQSHFYYVSLFCVSGFLCLFVSLVVCLWLYPSVACMVYIFGCLYVIRAYMSVSTCVSVYLCLFSCGSLLVCLYFFQCPCVWLRVCLSVCLFACVSVCLCLRICFFCMFVCRSVCFVCLSGCVSV